MTSPREVEIFVLFTELTRKRVLPSMPGPDIRKIPNNGISNFLPPGRGPYKQAKNFVGVSKRMGMAVVVVNANICSVCALFVQRFCHGGKFVLLQSFVGNN